MASIYPAGAASAGPQCFKDVRVPKRFPAPRPLIGAVMAAALALAEINQAAAQTPQPQAQSLPVPVNIEQCNNLSDPDVRAQIRSLTETALNEELARIDYAALVDKYWREAKLAERLDSEIDEAIRIERANTNLLDRAYSTISQETAEKTAMAVAERAYGSEGFNAALADLAQGVGKDFGLRVERAASRVSAPVIDCVKTALQSRYGGAVAEVFTQETQKNFDITAEIAGAKIDTGDLLLQNAGTVSGIVLIVSRRIIAQMVAGIGRRVAGIVASRIVASFTGLIGLALIAKDVYDATEGVFPLIEERMKSDEAKTLIKEELTRSIKSDLTQQTGPIAGETAERIYAFWLDFKQKYDVLLSLAEKSPDFAEFLKTRTADQLGRLGRMVSFLLKEENEAGVLQRTRDGTLRRALAALDDAGVALAVEIKSLDKALAWAELAGPRLAKAIEYGLPQLIAPSEIDARRLSTLLALDSRASALRIAGLEAAARDELLSLAPDRLKELARRLNERELNALAAYLQRLDRPAAGSLLRQVAADPGIMSRLARSSIVEAVASSRDQLSAIGMLLRDNAALNLANIGDDWALVSQGTVNYRIFLERYWAGLLALGALALLFLLAFRRLIFGRPPAVIIKTAEGGGKK